MDLPAWRCDSAEPGFADGDTRCDAAVDLPPATRTDEGFLVMEAFIARPGIYTYRNADGSLRRELVTAEELGNKASLKTLEHKPVTLGHPAGNVVTPKNAGRVSVGSVGGDVRFDDATQRVRASITVHRQDGIDAVDSGIRKMSPGYKVDYRAVPGVHPVYGAYDGSQHNRRYNHQAIVEAARGGPSMEARLDGEDAMLTLAQILALFTKHGLRADSEDHLGEDLKKLKEAQAERDRLQARVDSIPKAEAVTAERLAWFNERQPLVAKAAELRVDKAETLDNAALRKAIVLKARPSVRADASDDYYAAAYDLLPAGRSPASPWDGLAPETKGAESRGDGGEAPVPALRVSPSEALGAALNKR